MTKYGNFAHPTDSGKPCIAITFPFVSTATCDGDLPSLPFLTSRGSIYLVLSEQCTLYPRLREQREQNFKMYPSESREQSSYLYGTTISRNSTVSIDDRRCSSVDLIQYSQIDEV